MHIDDSSLFPHKLFQQFVIIGSKSLISGQLSHCTLSKWHERHLSWLITALCPWRNSFVITLTEAGMFQNQSYIEQVRTLFRRLRAFEGAW